MEYSDFDLINGIKNGDKDALSLLIRRWYPKIYSYCFKMTENEQDAYDITQDVFISVMQNIERFHIWNKFSSWIFTIAHNKCMDYFRLRKKTHSEQVLEAELHVSPPALEDQIAVSDTRSEEHMHDYPEHSETQLFCTTFSNSLTKKLHT